MTSDMHYSWKTTFWQLIFKFSRIYHLKRLSNILVLNVHFYTCKITDKNLKKKDKLGCIKHKKNVDIILVASIDCSKIVGVLRFILKNYFQKLIFNFFFFLKPWLSVIFTSEISNRECFKFDNYFVYLHLN